MIRSKVRITMTANKTNCMGSIYIR
jgi:hypothetical protein